VLKSLFGLVLALLVVCPILWYADLLPASGMVHELVKIEIHGINVLVHNVQQFLHRDA
jgi:hypothetical protein